MSIASNLNDIKEKLPEQVQLVAVTKTKPVAQILEAYNAGQRIFGENKIQEMATKWVQLPKDIEWHMIGHVQRNKVKYMAEFVDLIHGVDSLKLLTEIDKQAKRHERDIKCLLQVKIASENSKFGMESADVHSLLNSETLKELTNIKIVGLMGMATFTEDIQQLTSEFEQLKTLYDSLEEENEFINLSMGMSGDFKTAINCGSTMVRIGSAIFGERNYN